MEGCDLLVHSIQILAIHPYRILLPVDQRIVWQDAVGVNKQRDATAAQCLVETVGEVSTAAYTEYVIASGYVPHIFLPCEG